MTDQLTDDRQLTDNHAPAVAPTDAPSPKPGAPRPARRTRRPAGWAIATTVAVGVAAALVGWTVHVNQERRETGARQATARADLRQTSAELARVTADVDAVRATSAAQARTLATVEQQLAGVKAQVSQDQAGQLIEAATIAALDTCLGGVEAAVNQTALGDGAGAAQSLAAVTSSCQAVQGGGP
jgi:hypothetical protein